MLNKQELELLKSISNETVEQLLSYGILTNSIGLIVLLLTGFFLFLFVKDSKKMDDEVFLMFLISFISIVTLVGYNIFNICKIINYPNVYILQQIVG